MTNLRILPVAELPWANARYAEIGFQPSTPADFIAVAEIDGERAGIGRLVPVDAETGELGGMYVLPGFRGHGVAAAIVGYLLKASPYRRLYCIPFAHLEHFYRGFGFVTPAAGDPLPAAVAGKTDWCRTTYPDPVSLLVRDIGDTPTSCLTSGTGN